MTPGVRSAIPVAVVIALTISVSCRSSSEREAAAAAEDTSQVAASTNQEQLWQKAAEEGAPGLERVPVVQDPISQRDRSGQGGSTTPKPPQTVTIPGEVQNEIRILVFPDKPFDAYMGPAKVTGIDQTGQQIDLELGGRTLTVLVRINGNRLPLSIGEMVSLAYETRRDPRVANDVIAIRKDPAGAGIADVMRGSKTPLQGVNIPLFGITARQSDSPGLAEPPVEFSGPAIKGASLTMGQTAPLGGDVSVRVVGSSGLSPGADIGLIEGVPFAINVLVWRVP